MFDCGAQLYLWQGWIPSESEAEDPESPTSITTGSGKVRWHAERRAAMQTMLEYRKAKYGNPVPAAKLVWAGNESKDFINYFPQWAVNQEVAKINKEVSTPEFSKSLCFYIIDEVQLHPAKTASHNFFVLAREKKVTFLARVLRHIPILYQTKGGVCHI